MNLAAAVSVYGYGTSEGVKKEWDTRGRGRKKKTAGTSSKDDEYKAAAALYDHGGWITKDGKLIPGEPMTHTDTARKMGWITKDEYQEDAVRKGYIHVPAGGHFSINDNHFAWFELNSTADENTRKVFIKFLEDHPPPEGADVAFEDNVGTTKKYRDISLSYDDMLTWLKNGANWDSPLGRKGVQQAEDGSVRRFG